MSGGTDVTRCRSRAALVAIGLAMTACSQPEGVERVACEGLETSIIAAPLTRAGLRERFGAPDSVAGTVEPNRHVQGAIDSLFTVYYPGLQASFRTPTDARDLISRATISSNHYVRYIQIGIGTSAAQVRAALGSPGQQNSTELIYDCNEEANQPVTFRLRDGVVEAISIEYYVD